MNVHAELESLTRPPTHSNDTITRNTVSGTEEESRHIVPPIVRSVLVAQLVAQQRVKQDNNQFNNMHFPVCIDVRRGLLLQNITALRHSCKFLSDHTFLLVCFEICHCMKMFPITLKTVIVDIGMATPKTAESGTFAPFSCSL